MRFSFTLLFSLFFFSAYAQWTVHPILPKFTPPKSGSDTVTTKPVSKDSLLIIDHDTVIYLKPLTLPFWDDFSSSNRPYYPDSTKWQYGRAVSWNFGVGINPPSLGVVSFDGLDSLQNPYDVTNNLDKNYGDRLTSWTINLDTPYIAKNERDSVYLSFFFEFQGHAEMPDPGDHLLIEFRTDSARWETMAEVNVGDATLIRSVRSQSDSVRKTDSTFYAVSIQVDSAKFFHNQFQFRISSFGRISGPWDNWELDYVYLNKHRSADPDDLSFPDRAIFSPLSSLFGNYWSIPARHFRADSANIIVAPTFGVTNLRLKQSGNEGQPVSFSVNATIAQWKNGIPTSNTVVKLDSAASAGIAIVANEKRLVPLQKLPTASNFIIDSDSIRIGLKAMINSGDNLIDKVAPRDTGDYLPKFAPIDFRVNDTTRSTQMLSNYYAYDDGSAEFAAGLNTAGTEFAYRFDMLTNNKDYLSAVDFYFPNVGDESNQTIVLVIRKDTTEQGTIYSETINLVRSSENRFVRHILSRNNVTVQGHFYLGYIQTSSGIIALGLDTSHDTADKIFFNVIGIWETAANSLYGSLMIHPVFTTGVVSGLESEPVALDLFPNPTQGSFYLSKQPDQIEMLDFTGRKIDFSQDKVGDQLKVNISNPTPGIYLMKAALEGQTITRKVMVLR